MPSNFDKEAFIVSVTFKKARARKKADKGPQPPSLCKHRRKEEERGAQKVALSNIDITSTGAEQKQHQIRPPPKTTQLRNQK